ncbi:MULTISPECIES: hypothetical protein [Bacillus cereus group]|uniref:hypothetical protein n=1 Tax=Bacillus cereus group TaxID=86661 RepID=UPI001F59DC74|nr:MULTISPECIES: hypothetical protein [unclassified Bacillus cereus group]
MIVNSACKHIRKIESDQERYIYKTDFEYIVYESNEFEKNCFYLEEENVLYIRFIYAPDINKNFPKSKYQSMELNKFFFLPTHKTKEFKQTINSEEKNVNHIFSGQLKDFYTSEMIEELSPSGYYTLSSIESVHPDDRGECSTSLFILFDKNRFDQVGEITYDGILKFDDIQGMSEAERRELLLKSGLDICSQIPLYKYLVSFGQIKLNQGILEWDKTLRTDSPEPGSSHVHFFKVNQEIENIDFQDVANQFQLVDEEIFNKRPKKKKSRRREALLNETK